MMSDSVLIIDALSAGSGKRTSSRDSIGCGPRSVAGIFEKHGFDCRIYRAEEILEKKSIMRKFDHIAISSMTMDMPATRKIMNLWRSGARHSGRAIIGGPIASDSRVIIKLGADLLVIGEGEATLEELIERDYFHEKIELLDVLGIAFAINGRVAYTRPREFISSESLSSDFLPSTTRILDYKAYQASKVYVEVTRGCSNFRRTRLPLLNGSQCSECGNCDADEPETRLDCPEDIPPGCGFCSVPGTWGPPRSRSAVSIVREIKELLDLGVHKIVLESPGFLDYFRGSEPLTDPCHPPANLSAIKDLLGQINNLPQVIDGTAHITIENMKACLFTDEVAQMLVESMMSSSPNIGLETGSEKHMHQIGKCGNPQDVLSAVKIASKYGMKPFVYFIYGLPGEDEDSVNDSITMMRQISEAGAERIILYGFRSLPGSAFENYPSSSTSNPLGAILRREADRINRVKKDDYIGKIVRGIAAEQSWVNRGYTMVYPLEEGPLMTVPGGFSAGTLLNIRITKVLSSGLLEGVALQSS
ncbi:MAG: B12-binding domain-containing radical SAM protein [Candidatus Thorarchaeota archaeon]|nr:B12-binding domain-containing radical SAM protein [Candidatus Thorarchaeota archaeon]